MPYSLKQLYGLARSAVIYRGQPLKHRRARALYAQFVPAGGLCFDIGAHIGGRVAMFRQSSSPIPVLATVRRSSRRETG